MLAIIVDKTVMSLCFSLIISSVLCAQSADRPTSEELLPETTVAYVQITNVRDFIEKMEVTNIGRMLADERIAPLVGDLYSTAQDAYSEVEDRVGLSLEEIQSLPAGEICFAVIAPKRETPAFVLIIDTDEESETVEKILQRGRDMANDGGVDLETDETDDVTFEKFMIDGQPVAFFRKGGTLVIGTNQDELDAIVDRWMGRKVEKVRPLNENRTYIRTMNRCRGTKETPPDLRFFVDPIKLAKSATRGNVAAQAGLNFLPLLGLDGFLAVGGSAIIDELDFESVTHMHVLLSNPRAGVFEMLALKPGQYEPQTWVPDNAVSYMSTSWDVQKAFAEFEKIFDSFFDEGALAEAIEENVNDELGIDFQTDVIDQLSGRFTYVQWVGKEITINGQINALGVELNDKDEIMNLVNSFLGRIREDQGDDAIEEVEYQGVTFWQMPDEKHEQQRERMKNNEFGPPVSIRLPQPGFVIIDEHLIVSDSAEFIKRAIDTARGKEKSLRDDAQFQYVGRQMTRLLGTDVPGAVVYSQPEETMRMLFEVANGDDTRNFLDDMAEDNKYAKGIRDALQNNPLPDFDEIKDYFPPSGAFITNDSSGYHMLAFQLKSTVKD